MCQWHRELLARDVLEKSRLAIQRRQNEVVHKKRKRKVLSHQRNAELNEYSMFPYTARNVYDIAATSCANKIRLDLLCFISVNGLEFQRKLFGRLLTLPMLQIAMPNYVVTHKELLQCEVACKSLKYGVRKDQYWLRML